MTCTDLELLTRELDKDPTNHNLLFALGELWEETEPGIGDGVRALVVNGRVPWWASGSRCWAFWDNSEKEAHGEEEYRELLTKSFLPTDWFTYLRNFEYEDHQVKIWYGTEISGASKAYLAAARAFLKLPKEKQEQYLEGNLEEQ